MKKSVFLLTIVFAVVLSVWGQNANPNQTFIKNVMLIGGSSDEVTELKATLLAEGWIDSEQDLNAGAGGDFIYLLYKTESNPDNTNMGFITDFYLWTENSDAPDTRTYNGRTYHLVPYDGGDHFISVRGNLNSNIINGADIHLYYTKDLFPDNRSVTSIYFDSHDEGALGSGGSSSGYDLNKYAGGDYIYMHFTTATTLTGHQPQGSLNVCEGGVQEISVSGWAYDPDAPSQSISVQVQVYMSNGTTLLKTETLTANQPVDGMSGNHGFSGNIQIMADGSYKVKVIGVDYNGDSNTQIGETTSVNVTRGPMMVTIGDGNHGLDYMPFHMSAGYSFTQQIYLAEELPTSGTITSIAFNYCYYDSFSMDNVRIFMQHTDKSGFDNENDAVSIDASTQVYEGSFSADSYGWIVLELDTPFEYDGNSNLLLSCYNPNESNFASYYTFLHHRKDNNGLVIDLNENGPTVFEDLANCSGTRRLRAFRNNIQFIITPQGVSRPINPSVSQITDESVTLTWIAPDTSDPITDFSWQYKKTGDADWSDEAHTTNSSVSIDGLDSYSEYQFRVKTHTINGESTYAIIKFLTNMALPYELGFENGIEQWEAIDPNPGYLYPDETSYAFTGIRTHAKYEGDFGFQFVSWHLNQYLVSPALGHNTALTVSLYYHFPHNCTKGFWVGYSTTTNNIDDFIWGDNIFDNDREWRLYVHDFPENTKYIAIKYPDHEHNLLLDCINIIEYSPYAKPANLTASNITETGATLSWTAAPHVSPIGYAYQYRVVGDATWSAEVNVNSTSVTLSNLSVGTTYDFRVKALYTGNKASNFVTTRFITESPAEHLPFTQGFENGMGGWRLVEGDHYTGIQTDPNWAHDGTCSFCFFANDADQYLISPRIDHDGYMKMSFWVANYREGSTNYKVQFSIGYSTTNKDLESFIWGGSWICNTNTWIPYSSVFPPDTKYVSIKWEGGLLLYLDDFSFIPIVYTDVSAGTNWNDPSSPIDGWHFIASPLTESIAPTAVDGLVFTVNNVPVPEYYDLYRLNNITWENYKAHTEGFMLENGKGYLYANKTGTTLTFAGAMNQDDTKKVSLSPGYNLVGNPFLTAAYVNRPFYKMNDTGSDIEAVTDYANTPIPAFNGVVVEAAGENDTVVFSKAQPSMATHHNGSLQMTLTRAGVRGDAMQDKAVVSFDEGVHLEKFVFNEGHAKLYIPQGDEDYAIAFGQPWGEVPVCFKAAYDGEYTLHMDLEDVAMGYLHLIDNLTGADVDLLQTPSYTFEGKAQDYASRFKLVYAEEDLDDLEGFALVRDGEIVVVGRGVVQIFDMLGRQVFTKETSALHGTISTSAFTPGVYVLRLTDGEKVKTQKLVVKNR